MEFRCEWCGKPHHEDDPPCEACGHGSFERAVVRQHHDPEPSDPVWTCTECGRTHERHSPPCSRCGNTTLEQTERDYGDLPDGTGPTYRDLASRRYVAVAGVALVGIAVLALAVTGVVSLPGSGGGHPTVSDVPGHGETYHNASLAAAERGFVAQMNDHRSRTLSRDDELAALAEYANRKAVKATYADGDPATLRELQEKFSPDCNVQLHQSPRTGTPLGSLEAYDSGRELGEAVATNYLTRGWTVSEYSSEVGVDVHVTPAGTVSVTVATC